MAWQIKLMALPDRSDGVFPRDVRICEARPVDEGEGFEGRALSIELAGLGGRLALGDQASRPIDMSLPDVSLQYQVAAAGGG